MKKALSLLLVITLILLINIPTTSAAELEPYSYVVIDRVTGDILLEKNADEMIYPASTTKILTAIVALENTGLSSFMTASDIASGELESGAVRLGIVDGEKMQFYDLMHALLLKSANDVALMIGENIAGSTKEFADMCNNFAYSIGAINTHFVNPHGLHNDDHYTTAHDLAIMANYALQNYTFSSIVSKKEYTLNETNVHDSFPKLVNSNPILGENDGYNFLVTGVKTGYTSKAKYVLVSSARNYDGREVICVVTGCENRSMSASYSLDLINRAYNDFAYQSIVTTGDIVHTYTINNIDIPLASSQQIDYLLPKKSETWKLRSTIDLYENNNNSIYKGDILGEISYLYNDKPIGQSYLVATREFVPTTLPNEQTILITNENNNKVSNSYIIFIISIAWVIILVSLLMGLSKIKKNENEE